MVRIQDIHRPAPRHHPPFHPAPPHPAPEQILTRLPGSLLVDLDDVRHPADDGRACGGGLVLDPRRDHVLHAGLEHRRDSERVPDVRRLVRPRLIPLAIVRSSSPPPSSSRYTASANLAPKKYRAKVRGCGRYVYGLLTMMRRSAGWWGGSISWVRLLESLQQSSACPT